VIQSQLWQPYPDNTVRPNDPVRRSDALSTLVHWLESVRPDLLRNAVFSSAGSTDTLSSIVVKGGNKDYEIPLARDLRLFRLAAGRSTPVESLKVIGNERVRYHVGPDGAVDFLEVALNSNGAASDRYSPVAVWEASLARTAVAEKLRGMAEGIGELRDIRPARLGSSGRVVQMQIVGSRGSVTLNGYKVRNALGLRDTLFTISREVNPAGVVDRFTFRGRGWGHGVGLCQVGAFGMARAGRSFEEILKTYYQGVELRKVY
jgi:stage II sporulation protein D